MKKIERDIIQTLASGAKSKKDVGFAVKSHILSLPTLLNLLLLLKIIITLFSSMNKLTPI